MEPASQGDTGTVAITGAPRPITKEPNPGPLEAVNCKWFAFAAKAEVQPKSGLFGLEHQGHVTSGIQCQSLEMITLGAIEKPPAILAFL